MVSAAHFSFMGICRNTTFEVLYYNLFSGISRWYHYHKSEVNSMKTEKKEINIQIGKRLQTARENSGYTQEVFAETLDVGVEHYRKIESGVYGLQPEKMLILYEKYRIEPTYLVTGDTNHKVDIELFKMTAEKIVVSKEHDITFCLYNGLKLTERGGGQDAVAHANRL